MDPAQILLTHFGYSQFRPFQSEIVEALLAGQDVLALLPTGGGKSICYQVPGLLLPGVTLVISPLISLMKDQVDELGKRGVPAIYINSSLSLTEMTVRLKGLSQRQYRFVYIAPERLQTQAFIRVCQTVLISLIAVDEAHCISQWGHDFRPAYRQIAAFVSQLPRRPPLGAFTATATPKVQQDIIGCLNLKTPRVFTQSFRRANLWLEVADCENIGQKELRLMYVLKHWLTESTLIYTGTHEATESVAKLIQHFWPRLKVGYYHAGLSAAQRIEVQEQFLHDQLAVMVATNAFGMGINKPNIRCLIHYQLPLSLEQFYQEVGRAGRDGLPSQTWLLSEPHDVEIAQELIRRKPEDRQSATSAEAQVSHKLQLLEKMIGYVKTRGCRNHYLLQYFGQEFDQACHHCDKCESARLLCTPAEHELFLSLKKLRRQLATKYQLPLVAVAPLSVLEWLTLLQPKSAQEYVAIPGIGPGWMAQWQSTFAHFFREHEPHNPSDCSRAVCSA